MIDKINDAVPLGPRQLNVERALAELKNSGLKVIQAKGGANLRRALREYDRAVESFRELARASTADNRTAGA